MNQFVLLLALLANWLSPHVYQSTSVDNTGVRHQWYWTDDVPTYSASEDARRYEQRRVKELQKKVMKLELENKKLRGKLAAHEWFWNNTDDNESLYPVLCDYPTEEEIAKYPALRRKQ